MNNLKIIKNKISLKNIKYWRWLGFILAVVGAYILGNADVLSQWLSKLQVVKLLAIPVYF